MKTLKTSIGVTVTETTVATLKKYGFSESEIIECVREYLLITLESTFNHDGLLAFSKAKFGRFEL